MTTMLSERGQGEKQFLMYLLAERDGRSWRLAGWLAKRVAVLGPRLLAPDQ